MQETVGGCGISWAICKSAPCPRQVTTPAPHHSVFYRFDVLPAAQPTASKAKHTCITNLAGRIPAIVGSAWHYSSCFSAWHRSLAVLQPHPTSSHLHLIKSTAFGCLNMCLPLLILLAHWVVLDKMPLSSCYFAPVCGQGIVVSVFVCLSVCVHPLTYIKNQTSKLHQIYIACCL